MSPDKPVNDAIYMFKRTKPGNLAVLHLFRFAMKAITLWSYHTFGIVEDAGNKSVKASDYTESYNKTFDEFE